VLLSPTCFGSIQSPICCNLYKGQNPLHQFPRINSTGSKQKNCAHFEESMKFGMDKL